MAASCGPLPRRLCPVLCFLLKSFFLNQWSLGTPRRPLPTLALRPPPPGQRRLMLRLDVVIISPFILHFNFVPVENRACASTCPSSGSAATFGQVLLPLFLCRYGRSDSVIPRPHDALTAEASAPPRALHVRGDFPGPRHPRPPPSGIPFGCTVLRVSLPCPRESGRAWPPSRAESVRRRTPPRVLPQGSSQQRRQRHQLRCVMEEQPLPPRPHTCPPGGAAQLPHPRLQPGPPSPASPGDGLGVRPLPFTPSPDPRALGHLLALRSGDCSSAT